MAKPIGPTVYENSPPESVSLGYGFEDLPEGVIEVSDLSYGMINRAQRSQVPQGSARVLTNARVRDDWTGRRPGTEEFGPTKPDSDPVYALITFITEAQDFYLCRISQSGFWVLDAAQEDWIQYDIVDEEGAAVAFPTVRTGISVAQFFDKMYLANGHNKIMEVDFGSATVMEIDDAPRAKYIETFGDRIVAGNVVLRVGGLRASGVAWCVNANPRKWSGLSSGFEDLAATEIGDEITGVFALEDTMIILRRNSLVPVSRQPFADAPFRFGSSFKGIGSDIHYAGAKVPGGIIFPDQRTREIYFFSIGALPQPIAANLNRTIFEDLEDVRFAIGSLDPYELEYHLGICTEADNENITKTWVCSIERNFSWSLDDSPEVSTIGIVSLPGVAVSINDLVGTINAQTGTIDDYGDPGGFQPSLFKGTDTGEVIQQTYDAIGDWNDEEDEEFLFTFQSPNLGSISRRRAMQVVEISVLAPAEWTYEIENSKDEDEWRNTKTASIALADPDVRQKIRLLNPVEGNDLFWKLTSKAPGLKLFSWFARFLEKGLQIG